MSETFPGRTGATNSDGAHFYRKPDGGYVRPVFKPDGLRRFAAQIPGDSNDPDSRAYGLGLCILSYVFGPAWLERHVLSEPKDGFLARPLGDETGSAVVVHRVRDLAEIILNLQLVPGVESPWGQLAGGDIESGVAELEVGKLLANRGRPFRFIVPSGVAGESFDLEIELPNGTVVCGDTKCKFEEKPYSSNSFRNTLEQARKRNLPKERPGVIFVKIPQSWPGSPQVFSSMENVIWRFLRQTSRVVSVQVYCAIVCRIGAILHDQVAGWEYVNPVHSHGAEKDWRVFAANGGTLPANPHWLRLADIVRGSTSESSPGEMTA